MPSIHSSAGDQQDRRLVGEVLPARQVDEAGQGGGDGELAELEQSLKQHQVDKVDLMLVHNLGGVNEMLPVLRELKEAGKTRYIGVTTTAENQYPELERLLRNEKMDFVQVDYAIDNREVEQRILPLAQERGVACKLVAGKNRKTRVLSRCLRRNGELVASLWPRVRADS